MGREILHSRPLITSADIARVAACLRCGQVSAGPAVRRFEKTFARRLGVSGAAAVSSGSAALHLALLGLGVGPGDEVIIPTHVCAVVLHAVRYAGARPVLADADPLDGNIAPADVQRKITRRTRAIVVAHLFGQPAQMARLGRLGIPLIEDGTQALGALCGGKPAGSLGSIGLFSFYATKMMTTGEGGLLVTGDGGIIGKVRDLLSYDHREDATLRFNYKMSDLQAALGLSQLARLRGFIARRRALARFYGRALQDCGAGLPAAGAGTDPVYYRYVIRVRDAAAFVKAMQRRRVCAQRPLFRPLHRYLGQKGFPGSEKLMRESVSIPIYPALTQDEAGRVVKAVRAAAGEVRA